MTVYFSGCAALIGFALAYALPIYARLPKPFYDPIARRWAIAAAMGPLPMGYVGQLAWGVGGALVGGALAVAVMSRLRSEPGHPPLKLPRAAPPPS